MEEKIESGAGAPTDEADKIKKKRIRDIVIAVVIILLLLGAGIFAFFYFLKANEDPDIAIAKLINENATAKATNSYQGYQNSKNVGYVLDDLMLSKEARVILWDSINDCYLLYEGEKLIYSPIDNPATGYDLWIFVNDVPANSAFCVYWAGENTVTKAELENGVAVDKEYVYTAHQYKVTNSISGNSRTYTCTEDGCGYSYTVKNK